MRKVGVIGTGGMGRVHARQYAKFDDVELFAFDVDRERATAYADDTRARLADSLDELIKTVDVVDVCVPTSLHLEFASASLNAGKPTFCEKPLCRTVEDCAKLVELSDKLRVPLMPAQVVRYFPEFRRAHNMVQQGAVGKPAAIRTRRGGGFPKGAGGWFGDFSQSGGVIMDLAIHDYDWIRWTFGEVTRVYAQSLTFSGIKDMDYSLATLTLESGAIAHVEGTWADPGGFRVSFEIAGSEGFIEHDSRSAPSLRVATASGASAEGPMAALDDPYYLEIKGFFDALDSGAPPPVAAVDGLRAVAICEAAIESTRTGRPIAPARI